MINFNDSKIIEINERDTYKCVAKFTIRILRVNFNEMIFNNMWFDNLQIKIVVVR